MRIVKNLCRGIFWADYFLRNVWMERLLPKMEEDFDFSKAERKQWKRLTRYARRAFPEYYKGNGLDGTEPLSKYPLLTKQDIREHTKIYTSKYLKWIEHHKATTGGSTGTPFGFELSANYDPVHQEHLWKLMGYQKGDRIICVNGSSIPEKKRKKHIYYEPLSKTQMPCGGYALSCLYLTDETAKYYFQFMEKISPAYLRGYTSAIYRLAQYVEQHGLKPGFCLKGIQLTSETAFEYQIEYIERVFDTKVYLQYGHTEAAVFAYTCDGSHRYKCSPLYGHVEVLDESGKHVKPGETGEVVATSYSNYAMPFIRYRTGDMAEYGGTNGAVVFLNKIWGRTQDVVYTKNKEEILLTALIFGLHYRAFEHIYKWKIVQREYGKVLFRVVRTPEYSATDENELRESFRRNAGIETEFEYVENIELTRRGKTVFVEQQIR